MQDIMDLGRQTQYEGEGQGGGVVHQELTTPVPSSFQLPVWAKTAAMGLVAGAVVGMVVVPVMSSQGILNDSKAWQASAVGAAVAAPLLAAYPSLYLSNA